MTEKEIQDIKLNIANQLFDNAKLGLLPMVSGILTYPQFELITNEDGMGLVAYCIRERFFNKYQIILRYQLNHNNIPCLGVRFIYYGGPDFSIQVRYKEEPSEQNISYTIDIINELLGVNIYKYQRTYLDTKVVRYEIHIDKLINLNRIVNEDFESQLKNMDPLIEQDFIWKGIIQDMLSRL